MRKYLLLIGFIGSVVSPGSFGMEQPAQTVFNRLNLYVNGINESGSAEQKHALEKAFEACKDKMEATAATGRCGDAMSALQRLAPGYEPVEQKRGWVKAAPKGVNTPVIGRKGGKSASPSPILAPAPKLGADNEEQTEEPAAAEEVQAAQADEVADEGVPPPPPPPGPPPPPPPSALPGSKPLNIPKSNKPANAVAPEGPKVPSAADLQKGASGLKKAPAPLTAQEKLDAARAAAPNPLADALRKRRGAIATGEKGPGEECEKDDECSEGLVCKADSQTCGPMSESFE